jgi:hypothetical protein
LEKGVTLIEEGARTNKRREKMDNDAKVGLQVFGIVVVLFLVVVTLIGGIVTTPAGYVNVVPQGMPMVIPQQ